VTERILAQGEERGVERCRMHRDRRETLPCAKRRPPLCGCPGAPAGLRRGLCA